MKDTPKRVELIMQEKIRQKTPAQRVKMGCDMYDFSKELIVHAIQKEMPKLSPSEQRQEVFLKFYGQDFSVDQRNKIIRHLTNFSER